MVALFTKKNYTYCIFQNNYEIYILHKVATRDVINSKYKRKTYPHDQDSNLGLQPLHAATLQTELTRRMSEPSKNSSSYLIPVYPLKVPERYEKCLWVSPSVKGKSLPVPSNGFRYKDSPSTKFNGLLGGWMSR